MVDDTPEFKGSRFLLGLAGSVFVAALALTGGWLIILGTRSDAYQGLERALGRFVGG